MLRALLLGLLLCTPAFAEPFALDLPAGEHFLKITVAADGAVSAVPLRVVQVGNKPTEPKPQPTDTPLQVRVKQLTREALAAGGKPETAAKLAGVYALVSDYCADGTVSPEIVRGTADKPGFLTQATDLALKDSTGKQLPDAAAWTTWRQGLGTELALRHPTTPTKEALAATLAEVSSAIKSHLGGVSAASGEKLTIPWSEIIELLRPLLRDLLLKLLSEWINKPK